MTFLTEWDALRGLTYYYFMVLYHNKYSKQYKYLQYGILPLCFVIKKINLYSTKHNQNIIFVNYKGVDNDNRNDKSKNKYAALHFGNVY